MCYFLIEIKLIKKCPFMFLFEIYEYERISVWLGVVSV
jgi:hypothetical protein